MRTVLLVWLGACLGSLAPTGAVDLDAVFRAAWAWNPAARQATIQMAVASLNRDAERGKEFPSLTVISAEDGGPSLGSVSVSEEGRMATAGLGLSLGQRLPDGGRLTVGAQIVKTWSWLAGAGAAAAADPVFEMSLSAEVPLVETRATLLADQVLRVDVLTQQVARGDAFLALVRAASAVAVARQTVAWRRTLAAVTAVGLNESSAQAAQGRLAPVDLWRATQRDEEARWDLVEADAELASAEATWERLANTALPEVDVPSVLDFVRGRGPDTSWTVPLASAQKLLETLQNQAERSEASPSLGGTLWATRDPNHRWTCGGQVSLTLGTDGLILGAALARKHALVDQRWDSAIAVAVREAGDLQRLRTAEIQEVEETLARGGARVARLAQAVEASDELARRRLLDEAERLAAVATLRKAEVDQVRLAWRGAELAALLGPPAWVFR